LKNPNNSKPKHGKIWKSWRNISISSGVLLACGLYLFFVNPAISSTTNSNNRPVDPASAATAAGTLLSVAAAFYTTINARRQQLTTGELEQKKFQFDIQVKNWEQLEKLNKSLQERLYELEKEIARLDGIIEERAERIHQLQIEIVSLKLKVGQLTD